MISERLLRVLRGLFYIAEWWLRLPWPPPLRVWWLRRFGAQIGVGVRVHRCHFINLEAGGFGALTIGDAAHIGPECLFDMAAGIAVGARVALAPRVMVLTHEDVGSSSRAEDHPREVAAVRIGADAWIGAGAIILPGVVIGDGAIVGAGAVVAQGVAPRTTVGGIPAKPLRRAQDSMTS